MNTEKYIRQYWKCVAKQDEEKLREYFCKDAYIKWHNTNEKFDVENFLRANCDYPGNWDGEVEKINQSGNTIITAVHIWTKDISFHAVSFFNIENDLIKSLDEYWGEDGTAPQWRQNKHIGKPIHY